MLWRLIFIWIVQMVGVPIDNFTNAFPATVDNSTNPINNLTNTTLCHRFQPAEGPTAQTISRVSPCFVTIQEGDILILEDRLAVPSHWPKTDGVTSIPYEICDSLVGRTSTILAAFKMISDRTCIRFHEYTNEINYIQIRSGRGCASYVGFQGGAQPVYFSSTCKVGNLCHELLHTLGLHHEHTRLDRDRYVTIQWESVVPGKENNFKVKKGDTQNLPYDYNSIMQYGPYFFSSDRNPTIIPKKSGVHMGQRTDLSSLDITHINKLYNCEETTH